MDKDKTIRFIDSNYRTLFSIPDGGKINIFYPDGEQLTRDCKFLDPTHTQIGSNIYHICEFAEKMERIGAIYEPFGVEIDTSKYDTEIEDENEVER